MQMWRSIRSSLVLAATALVCQALVLSGAGFAQPPGGRMPEKVLLEEGRKGKLGIVARTIPNGAEIQYVIKDSPAYKTGLESGDVIVSVDGFTVGYIEGVEYPVQSEIRRVKGTGTFKIRSWRTGEIVVKKISITDEAKEDGKDGPPKDPEDPGPRPASSRKP